MAKFAPGDHVLLVDRAKNTVAGHSVWEVLAEDTNLTPVRDPEPAYKLRSVSHMRSNGSGDHVRYAYESCLAPIAILPAGNTDGQEVEVQGCGDLTGDGSADALEERT
jgi:hypothetical protein